MTGETRRLRKGTQDVKESHQDENKACIQNIVGEDRSYRPVEKKSPCVTPLRQVSLNTPSTVTDPLMPMATPERYHEIIN